jgi:hypothetical protein
LLLELGRPREGRTVVGREGRRSVWLFWEGGGPAEREKENQRGSCGDKRRRGCSVGSERRGCWFCEMGGCEWGKSKMVSGGLGTKKKKAGGRGAASLVEIEF